MSESDKSREFVEFILERILDDPEKAIITRTKDDRGEVLEIQVPEEEMGKLIGKGGKTAQSIRNLLSAMNAKSGNHVYLKILEPIK